MKGHGGHRKTKKTVKTAKRKKSGNGSPSDIGFSNETQMDVSGGSPDNETDHLATEDEQLAEVAGTVDVPNPASEIAGTVDVSNPASVTSNAGVSNSASASTSTVTAPKFLDAEGWLVEVNSTVPGVHGQFYTYLEGQKERGRCLLCPQPSRQSYTGHVNKKAHLEVSHGWLDYDTDLHLVAKKHAFYTNLIKKTVPKCTLVLRTWTSLEGSNFVNAYVMYVDDDWALNIILIGIRFIHDSVTGEIIHNWLMGLVGLFGLTGKVMGVVVQQDTLGLWEKVEFVPGGQLLGHGYYKCVGTGLSYEISAFFKSHGLIYNKLVSIFQLLSMTSHAVLGNLEFSENFVEFYRFLQILEMSYPLIMHHLKESDNRDLVLSEAELAQVSNIFIEPLAHVFQVVLEVVQRSKMVTPAFWADKMLKLAQSEHMPAVSLDPVPQEEMTPLYQVQKIFLKIREQTLLVYAFDAPLKYLESILDPRMRSEIEFDDNETRVGYLAGAAEYLEKYYGPASVHETVIAQLQRYLTYSPPEQISDPLAWWRTYGNNFPILSRAARHILCMVAFSLPADHIFTKLGDEVTRSWNSKPASTVAAGRMVFCEWQMFNEADGFCKKGEFGRVRGSSKAQKKKEKKNRSPQG